MCAGEGACASREERQRGTGQRGQRPAAGLLHDRGSVLRARASADLELSGDSLIVLVIVAVGACLFVSSMEQTALIRAMPSAIYRFSRTDATNLADVGEVLNMVRFQAAYEFTHVTCPAPKMDAGN